jgi:hypothetical protein
MEPVGLINPSRGRFAAVEVKAARTLLVCLIFSKKRSRKLYPSLVLSPYGHSDIF